MARARQDRRLFNAAGVEVFISLTCTKCRAMKPFAAFGFRKMPNGKLLSISQCTPCRGSGYAPKKPVYEPDGL